MIDRNQELFQECVTYVDLLQGVCTRNAEKFKRHNSLVSSNRRQLVEQEVLMWLGRLKIAVTEVPRVGMGDPRPRTVDELLLPSDGTSQRVMTYIKSQDMVVRP